MGGDEDSLMGEKKKSAMQKQLLTTSSKQTDIQPVSEQWTPLSNGHPTPSFPCFFSLITTRRFLQTILLLCCVSTNCIMWDRPSPTRKQYPFEDNYVSSVSFPGALNTPTERLGLALVGLVSRPDESLCLETQNAPLLSVRTADLHLNLKCFPFTAWILDVPGNHIFPVRNSKEDSTWSNLVKRLVKWWFLWSCFPHHELFYLPLVIYWK